MRNYAAASAAICTVRSGRERGLPWHELVAIDQWAHLPIVSRLTDEGSRRSAITNFTTHQHSEGHISSRGELGGFYLEHQGSFYTRARQRRQRRPLRANPETYISASAMVRWLRDHSELHGGMRPGLSSSRFPRPLVVPDNWNQFPTGAERESPDRLRPALTRSRPTSRGTGTAAARRAKIGAPLEAEVDITRRNPRRRASRRCGTNCGFVPHHQQAACDDYAHGRRVADER